MEENKNCTCCTPIGSIQEIKTPVNKTKSLIEITNRLGNAINCIENRAITDLSDEWRDIKNAHNDLVDNITS